MSLGNDNAVLSCSFLVFFTLFLVVINMFLFSFCLLNKNQEHSSMNKPKHSDPITVKEKFIQAKV